MTNHVHLVVRKSGTYKLEEIFHDIKKFTSLRIINEIKANSSESRKEWMIGIFKEKGQANNKMRNTSFGSMEIIPLNWTII
ncbi:MAG: hypothetical protein R2764_14250 [Bacteroidales bacterium]